MPTGVYARKTKLSKPRKPRVLKSSAEGAYKYVTEEQSTFLKARINDMHGSQEKLAGKLGLTTNALWAIINGVHRTNTVRSQEIAKALNLTVEQAFPIIK